MSPSTSSSYYVRGEGGCIVPGACDSTGIIVNPVYSDNATASICDGATYTFPDGSTGTATTTQVSTLTSIDGCDSVITTALTVNQVYNINEAASICGGVFYTFPDGDTSSSATVHTSLLSTVNGCDSTIVTTLTEDSAYTTGVSAIICPGVSYTFPDGGTATVDTTQISTLISIGGCDSIITTVLAVAATYNLAENVSVCSGGTYTFPDGTTSTKDTIYTSNLSTIQSCDSTITSTLTVDTLITSTESVNSCAGVTYIFPDGTISTISMTHTSNLTTPGGCDSNVTTILTVDPAITNNVNATICDGDTYTFPDGTTGTTATVQASYFSTGAGCDSIVITDLSVDSASVTSENVSMCDGDTYTFPDGDTSTTATIHTSNLFSVYGCDSTVTSNLTITTIDTNVIQSGNLLFAATADTYQWIGCEGNLIIGGATLQAYTVVANGSYKVALTVNGCQDTSECRYVFAVGVFENSIGPGLLVYPNPTGSQLYIDIGKVFKESLVQVMDMHGKVLYEAIHRDQRTIELSLEGFAQGLYLVKLRVDDRQAIIKVQRE